MFDLSIIVAVSLLGSFLCSLSEASLYAVSRSRIETLKRRKARGSSTLGRLRERVDEPISAILIVNTVVMTFGAIWSGALVEQKFGFWWMAIFSVAFTLLILFLGEIVPKSLGVRFADQAAPVLARPLQALVWSLWPLVKFASLITRVFGRRNRASHPTEQDIISMALLSEAGGKILTQEARWIRNILRLNDIKIKDIMTPAPKIKMIPAECPLATVKTDWEHWRYSRVLVAEGDDPERILGFVLRRSVFAALLRRGSFTTIRDLTQTVKSVRDDMPAHELVSFFVRTKTQLATVRDAAEKLVGVVTMEDVLEDMIGAEID